MCLCNTDLICTVSERNPIKPSEQKSPSFASRMHLFPVLHVFVICSFLLYFFPHLWFLKVYSVAVIRCQTMGSFCCGNSGGNNVSADCKSHKQETTQKLRLQGCSFFPRDHHYLSWCHFFHTLNG